MAGGSITIVAQSDVHGTDGEAVDAGQFRIHNTSDATETISEIRVEVTEPAMFSSLTLTADGKAVTITDPAEENSFFFDPEVQIAPGESIDVTLSAEIGQTSSGTSSPTPETSTTPSGTTTPSPTPTNTPSSTIASLAGRGPQGPQSPPPSSPTGKRDRFPHSGATALLAVALACAALASRSRRLGFVVSILLIALYAGCGSEQTSSQTVAGITASNGSGPVTMDGLPASLGTVSRPQPLLFPGAKK